MSLESVGAKVLPTSAERERIASAIARRKIIRALAVVGLLAVSAFNVPSFAANAAPTVSPVVYTEPMEDLRVKVLGGSIVIQRTFTEGKWQSNYNWAPLRLTFDSLDGSVKSISRGKIDYVKTAPGVFSHLKRNTITQTASGFHWDERTGNTIDFDAQGLIVSYSDRNNVKVSFIYETTGSGKRVVGIKDHLDRQLITYEYTADQLTAIRDYTNRRVQYQYTSGNLTFVIDVNGNTWTYGYTSGVPTSFTDPEGRTITRSWASNGEIASIRYADGVGTDYKYEYDSGKTLYYKQEKTTGGRITETWTDPNGEVTRVDLNGRTIKTQDRDTVARTRMQTDPRGLKTVRSFDEWDNEIQVKYPDGATVSATYDPVFSNLTQNIDERGVITKYEYDAKGNLIKFTEALGKPEQRVTDYAYDANGNRLTETRRGGLAVLPDSTNATTPDAVTTFEYDGYGNMVARIDPEGFRTEWSGFDAIGNPRTVRDARQKLWSRTYDNRGMLTSDSDPLDHKNQIEYDRAGWRRKSIDAANNEALEEYNLRGILIKSTNPYGVATRLEYDSHGQLTKLVHGDGTTEIIEYDADGQQTRTVDGAGNATTYVYGDSTSGLEGFLAKIVYPTYSQEFKYDARGRISEIIDVLGDTTRLSTRIIFDAGGNLTGITDRANKPTSYGFDSLRRLKTRVDAAQSATEYAYDSRDNAIVIRDGKGQIHHYEYDRRNLKTREVLPLGQSTTYSYNPTGTLETVVDAKGQMKRFSYDDAGRKTSENHYNSVNDTVAAKSIIYGFTNLGGLSTWNDGTVSSGVAYDSRQIRKLGETINYGPFSLNYSYGYDASGRKSSFTAPDGVAVSYTYGDGDQASSIGLPIGNLTLNQYHWLVPEQTTFPGGSVRTQTYDPLLRVTQIKLRDPAQNERLNHQYAYDAAGNIQSKITEQGNYNYSYDNLYRLIASANPSPLTNETYTYDALSNRLTDSNISGTWQYDANNQLTVSGNVTFNYDLNGNAIERVDGATVTKFIYDTDNRLIQVRDGNNDAIVSYYYDPFGRRLWKDLSNTRTHFLYSDEGLIAEANNAGAIAKLYGYMPHSTWGTNPVYLKEGTAYYFYQNDQLGTPQKLIATDGVMVWSGQAQAFGRTVVDSSAAVTNNLRFPGQYFDLETGLHYNWNRYYDPTTGRYLTRDPIRPDAGLNKYAYVDGSPITNFDNDGLYLVHIHYMLTKVAIDHLDFLCPVLALAPAYTAHADWFYTWDESQSPSNAYRHGMRDGTSNQTIDSARSKWRNFINEQLNACTPRGLGNAIHAMQDSFARGHRGFQPYYGHDGFDVYHFINDATPSPFEIVDAVSASSVLVAQFMSRCRCSCFFDVCCKDKTN